MPGRLNDLVVQARATGVAQTQRELRGIATTVAGIEKNNNIVIKVATVNTRVAQRDLGKLSAIVLGLRNARPIRISATGAGITGVIAEVNSLTSATGRARRGGAIAVRAKATGVTQATTQVNALTASATRAERALESLNRQGVRSQVGGVGAGGAGGIGALGAIAAGGVGALSRGRGSTITNTIINEALHPRDLENYNRLNARANELLAQRQALNARVSAGTVSQIDEQILDEIIQGEVNTARRELDVLDESINKNRESNRRLADSQARVSAGLSALAVGAGATLITFLGLGVAAVTASRANLDFSRSLAETATLLDGTIPQLTEITDQSIALAGVFGGTASAQAQGFYAIYSAGASNSSEALDRLTVANKLAIGGVADLGAATQLLTGTLNAYSAFGYDAIQVSNIFFEVVRNGITTIPQLAQSFSTVSAVAANFGVSLGVAGSALAAITATGTVTAQATTQVRSLLLSLQRLNAEQIRSARQLGVTSTDHKTLFRSFVR